MLVQLVVLDSRMILAHTEALNVVSHVLERPQFNVLKGIVQLLGLFDEPLRLSVGHFPHGFPPADQVAKLHCDDELSKLEWPK